MIEYLAIPYSHPDPAVREARFELANRIAADLMREGRIIYSPISHSHPIAKYGLPLDWEYWEKVNLIYLEMCSKMIVVMAEGWEQSIGIKSEIEIMERMGKEIEYYTI
jgi:hypothetical protein